MASLASPFTQALQLPHRKKEVRDGKAMSGTEQVQERQSRSTARFTNCESAHFRSCHSCVNFFLLGFGCISPFSADPTRTHLFATIPGATATLQGQPCLCFHTTQLNRHRHQPIPESHPLESSRAFSVSFKITCAARLLPPLLAIAS